MTKYEARALDKGDVHITFNNGNYLVLGCVSGFPYFIAGPTRGSLPQYGSAVHYAVTERDSVR